MRRLSPSPSFATRIVVFVQLATVAIGVGLLLEFRDRLPPGLFNRLVALAIFAAAITVYGWIATVRGHKTAIELAERMARERAITASLEQSVAARTAELEDAQRVLQRMWWLGQQITLELNPQPFWSGFSRPCRTSRRVKAASSAWSVTTARSTWSSAPASGSSCAA